MCVTQAVASFVASRLPAESAHVELGWQPECHHAVLLYEVHGHLAICTACHNYLCTSATQHCTSVLSVLCVSACMHICAVGSATHGVSYLYMAYKHMCNVDSFAV